MTKVYDWIAAHANHTPNQIAIEDFYSGNTFTYSEFDS